MTWKTDVFAGGFGVLCLPGVLFASSQAIHFDRLSIEHGLSQASVNCILQDRRGFMWFGTQDGLNRYDGYVFTVFRHEPAEPSSLSHNWVSTIVEDRQGALWVGTRSGLDRFDPATGTFRHFTQDPSKATSPGTDRVRSIHEDTRGYIWVGTEGAGFRAGARCAGTRRSPTGLPATA